MKIARHAALILAISGLSTPAFGCKLLSLQPQQTFKVNSVAVLAYPIAIATLPENALTADFRDVFHQTIQWQVLVSWKGPYRPGDVITTMTEHQMSDCGTGAQYNRETMLLFLDGKEPFTTPLIERPANSIRELKYLNRVKRGG